MIGHIVNIVHSQLREAAKRGSVVASALTGEAPRSPEWPTIERRWLKGHPRCAACGGTTRCQVHHKQSFATDPSLELHDGTGIPPATPPADGKPNFITLCMGPFECHLRIGHGGSFAKGGYNPNVAIDAQAALANPSQRSAIEARAKTARVSPLEVRS